MRGRRDAVAAVVLGVVLWGLLGTSTGRTQPFQPVRYRDLVFGTYTTVKDIPYGEAVDHTGQPKTLLLDVHEPAGDTATNRPAVVWVHGGYFKRGSKESYQSSWEHLVKAGYVTIPINYRLDPNLPEGAGPAVTEGRVVEYMEATFDAQHDAQAAVRWVRAHAGQLRIDPERIAIAGHSAGGITAQLVAFNDHDPGASGTPGVSSHVAAAVASAGGSLPAGHASIEPGEPPLLVTHGVVDDVVPYPAAVPSCALTILMGNVCEQVLDPDQDHGVFASRYWLHFLYRELVLAAPAIRPPTNLMVTGLQSLTSGQ